MVLLRSNEWNQMQWEWGDGTEIISVKFKWKSKQVEKNWIFSRKWAKSRIKRVERSIIESSHEFQSHEIINENQTKIIFQVVALGHSFKHSQIGQIL